MHRGYIKIPNDILLSPVFEDKNLGMFACFSWILLNADNETGDLETTKQKITEELNISWGKAHFFLKRLEDKKQVFFVINKKDIQIRVLEWEKYKGTPPMILSDWEEK